jgi:hypothetical protein
MAAAAAPATMDAYLEVTLGIGNVNIRTKITAEGYRSLDVLVKKDKAWVKALRLAIKRSSTGNAASREVTLEHEEHELMAGLKHDALGVHCLPEPYHEEQL